MKIYFICSIIMNDKNIIVQICSEYLFFRPFAIKDLSSFPIVITGVKLPYISLDLWKAMI
jgi:hypothetical protein